MWIRPDYTLLLVEPDPFIRRCLARALQQAGYRVLLANDAPEALDLLDKNPRIRLAISEVLLPSDSASNFLRQLRRTRRDLPVLFTSGLHPCLLNQNLPQREILRKPFSPDMLIERVARQLQPSRRTMFQGRLGSSGSLRKRSTQEGASPQPK